jgi:transposase
VGVIQRGFSEAAMARAYGDDLRGRVLDAAAEGTSARASAVRFGVGVSTAIAWIRRARLDGERSARQQGKPRGSRLDAHEEFVFGLIEADKDVTLNEMVERLTYDRGVRIGRSALSSWLRGRGWTFKKRRRTPPSRTAPTF